MKMREISRIKGISGPNPRIIPGYKPNIRSNHESVGRFVHQVKLNDPSLGSYIGA